MQRYLCLLLIVSFVFLIGCTAAPQGIALTPEQFNSKDPYACTVDDIQYIIKNKVMYHLDDRGRAYVDIPDGNYIQKSDKTGWTFKRTLTKDSSAYVRLKDAMLLGETAWKTAVDCEPVEQVPENFAIFLVTHRFVAFKYINQDINQENSNNQEGNQTNQTG